MKNRVATAQGKQGIWFLLFPDRENTGNFVVTQGKIWKHKENILTVIINIRSMFIFSRTVRSGRLIFSLWRVVGWLLVCGQLFQLFTPGGSPGSNFKY